MRLRARSGQALRGGVRPPGDKSISHRALILGALAQGVTEIEGLLEADDVLRTAAAARAFGSDVEQIAPGRWRVRGAGEFRAPAEVVDCGNSGTGARLLMGAAAGYPITARIDGDASLRRRPMQRIVTPLSEMGARFEGNGVKLPLTVRGGDLKGITYRSPVSSAQVKSAVLLAGLKASGETVLIEPARSRDHTERMLADFGAAIDTVEIDGAAHPRVRASKLKAAPVSVPADPSSAAFPVVAALIMPGSEVRIEGVLTNPLRIGLFETLATWARISPSKTARLRRRDHRRSRRARQRTKAVAPPATRAPSMIDEYPILAAPPRSPKAKRGSRALKSCA